MPAKKVSKKVALTSCGTHLKPGYRYVKGGGIVKVVAKKTTAKKAAPKKKTGLGRNNSARICRRQNPDGSHTSYNAFPDDNRPCPYGGTLTTLSAVLAAPKRKAKPKTKPKAAPRKKTTRK